MTKTLLIRADASPQMGTGHVMRCLSLGQTWQTLGGNVVFLTSNISQGLKAFLLKSQFEVIDLKSQPDSEAGAIETTQISKGLNAFCLAIDGYQFHEPYLEELSKNATKVLVIDDLYELKNYFGCTILNQNLYADSKLYETKASGSQLLMGSKFALLRSEFWPYRGIKRPERTGQPKILLTMGGSDLNNVTFEVLKALKENNGKSEIDIIVGNANRHGPMIQKFIAGLCQFKIKTNVDNMAYEMEQIDIAISAAGTSSLELAFMGIPSLYISIAENQNKVVKAIDEKQMGTNLGWYKDLTQSAILVALQKLIDNHLYSNEISTKCQSEVDGYGGERVIQSLLENKLHLIQARKKDSKLILDWANEPLTRQASFTSEKISESDHDKWFNLKLADPNALVFIGRDVDDIAVGQVRFESTKTESLISVSIGQNHHGKGYGREILNLACQKFHYLKPKTKFVKALIKPQNKASILVFEKVGFKFYEKLKYRNQEALEFRLTF